MEQNVQLEKKLSPVNVWSLALGCIIGWGAFVMPGNTFLMNAGPGAQPSQWRLPPSLCVSLPTIIIL